jgi:AmmeMemoRadiSam system protein B
LEIRKVGKARMFYPQDKDNLYNLVEACFLDKNFGPGEKPKTLDKETRSIVGGVSPHAGISISGPCAAITYSNLIKEKIPDTFIILGTDHIGYRKIALLEQGNWKTPLGSIKIDNDLAGEIINQSKVIIADDKAFTGPFLEEHNIDIQIPFVQYSSNGHDVKILPIKISTGKYDLLEELSSDIANVIKTIDKDVVVVASSDMNHETIYNSEEHLEKFRAKDKKVIDCFEEFNPYETLKAATAPNEHVCGPQTITSSMLIAKKINSKESKILKYYTSYDITKNIGWCVGYISGIFIK